LSLAFVAAQTADFGHVRVSSHPEDVEFNEEHTRNVFLSGLLFGSHLKVVEEIAIDLSKQRYASGKPKFNVSVATRKNNDKLKQKQSETLSIIGFDYEDYTAHFESSFNFDPYIVVKDSVLD
jgi:hypothetical protein